MRKRGRSTHNHAIHGDRHPLEMPGRELLSRTEAMRAVGEVLYAVRCDGLVKIGHTSNLAGRFKDLRAVEVLALWPGATYDDEQELHRQLADHLHHGREWYYPTPGVFAVVNDLRERLGQAPLVA